MQVDKIRPTLSGATSSQMWLKSAEVSGLNSAFDYLLSKKYFKFIFQNFVLVLFKIASLYRVSHNLLPSFFFNNEPRRLCGFKCTYLRFNYCKWLTVDVIKFNGLWKQLSVEDKERAGIDGGVHGSPRRPRPQMARAPPYLWRAAEASCVGCCSWVECSYSALSSFGFTSYFFF